MIIKRLHTIGTIVVWTRNLTLPLDIPKEVILEKDSRAEGGILRIDHIWIDKIVGGSRNGDFRLVLSEDGDGEKGGGIMGDHLDRLAKDLKIKGGFPCVGVDNVRGGDVYYVDIEELAVLWMRYKLEVEGLPSVSALASNARAANMAKARAVRLERKKHLRNHFQ